MYDRQPDTHLHTSCTENTPHSFKRCRYLLFVPEYSPSCYQPLKNVNFFNTSALTNGSNLWKLKFTIFSI